MSFQSGAHFLQIPGPTNVPERVLRALSRPTIDHRGPEFAAIVHEVLEGLAPVFKTNGPIVIYPSSGTGAWEAAIVNALSPGDRVLMFETGQFSTQWQEMAKKLGLDVDFVPGDWRHGVDPSVVEAKLSEDREHRIKAVMVLHNETATGVTSRIPEVRKAIDRARHPALLMVDTVSSLGSIDYRHDEWGVDVTVGGSQKGLMLPPGMGFNAISEKARAAAKTSRMPKSYWEWEPIIEWNRQGFYPYTPPTNMFYGLREAVRIINEEGLDRIFARHARHAEATRRAVQAWGLEIVAVNPDERSNTLTAVLLPDGFDADAFRKLVLERFNMALGTSFGPLKGRYFRIGHLGSFNDLMLAGTLSGVQMSLGLFGVPHQRGGVAAALEYLESAAASRPAQGSETKTPALAMV